MTTTRRKAMSAILGLGAGTARTLPPWTRRRGARMKLSKKPGFAIVMRCW